MDIKPNLEIAAKLPAKMIKLPVDVMVSSLESITKTLHEIQRESQIDYAEENGVESNQGKTHVVGNMFKRSVLPLFGMLRIPRNVFTASMETISTNVKAIKEQLPDIVSNDDDSSESFDRCIVPLSSEEAKLEKESVVPESMDSCARTTLWKIGRAGRIEFDQKWTPEFDYRVGEDVDAIKSPHIPTIITVQNGPKALGSTQKLNIHFELERDYSSGELAFVYDRWGGEKDQVFVDGVLVAPVGGAGEGMYKHVELLLHSISSGNHVITITASGDTDADGHRIDYFEMVVLEDQLALDVEVQSTRPAAAKSGNSSK